MKNILKVKSIVFFLFLLFSSSIFAQLTITVSSIPENTPPNDNIYIAGSFNGWNPGSSEYLLTNNGDGTYQITFTPENGSIEYKFARGSWVSVEGDAQGQDIANRTLTYSGEEQTEDVTILSWKDLGSGTSTAAENVSILDENFNIPQLNRTRRVWIYLPPDYDANVKSYPVLYMQDGQNIFDANTSFSGEWQVDEALNEMFANDDNGVIVVGIDNGGGYRIDEYSPWIHPEYGGGDGDKYVDFIVETLKPYIDNNFRTKSDRLHTGIMGSSLGALISFYAAIEHQDVFSKVGVFSPSFWFSDEVYTHVETTGKVFDMQIYMLGGEQESVTLIQEMNNMVSTLHNAGFEDSEVKMVTHQDGQHSEWYWRREFPSAYMWLFNRDNNSVSPLSNKKNIEIFPNPFSDSLIIKNGKLLKNAKFELYNSNGILEYSGSIPASGKIRVNDLKNGTYIFNIIENQETVFTQKLLHLGD